MTEEKGKTIENQDEPQETIDESDIFLSDFEKKCLKGRFILDKRQEITSKSTSVKK